MGDASNAGGADDAATDSANSADSTSNTNDATPASDAQPSLDAGADADSDTAKLCNTTSTFGAAQLVAGLQTGGFAGDLRLSQSELTAYYSLNTVDAGYQIDLFTATRATRQDAFSNNAPLSGLNSATLNDFAPTLNADETTLIFARSVPYALFISTRGSTASTFTSAAALSGPLGTEKTDIRDPYLTLDGATLFYADDPGGENHIYQSTLTGGVYSTGNALTEIETAAGEYRPVVSPDLHMIYWASSRTDLSPAGKTDIYSASRAATTGPFSGVRNVAELNTSGDDAPTWISPDNCRLYYRRDDGLYMASRPSP